MGADYPPDWSKFRSLPPTCASSAKGLYNLQAKNAGYCHGTGGQLANQWMMILFTLLLSKLIIPCLHKRFGL